MVASCSSSRRVMRLLASLICACATRGVVDALVASTARPRVGLIAERPGVATTAAFEMAAVPTKERTRAPPRTGFGTKQGERVGSQGGTPSGNPFEWAMDKDATRRDEDNFHILLLNSTFSKPRMSVAYAAGALCLVLAMPEDDAMEHSAFAMEQGFSCLGTWRRDECLKYAEQLQGRDLECRAVPGVKGRQAWQGSPANTGDPTLASGK